MHGTFALVLVFALVVAGCGSTSAPSRSSDSAMRDQSPPGQPASRRLPDLPDALGVAGPCCGVSNGALIVAGGTNFPGKMPWENGKKVWHDELYVLDSPSASSWKTGFKLPRPLAYGATVSTRQGMLCIGGGDGTSPSADVFLIHWNERGVSFKKLHDLPLALAGCGAAVIGDRVYVAGGSRGFDAAAQASEHVFYSLDLSNPRANWQMLEPWPGPERFYTVMAAAGDSVYVMSGMQRTTDDAGKAKLICLSDVYRYDTEKATWTKLADLPRAHAAAPTPASVIGERWVILIGGGVDDEALARPMNRRADFPHTITAYDLRDQKGSVIGNVSESPVATNQVKWGDEIVVASGEVRSGVRSAQVWAYRW